MKGKLALEVIGPPECPNGYPLVQLERELGLQAFRRLMLWMDGQTMMICEGRAYNHETREYAPDACADFPHGTVVYSWDVERWLAAEPIID